jgi:hypothetical protein
MNFSLAISSYNQFSKYFNKAKTKNIKVNIEEIEEEKWQQKLRYVNMEENDSMLKDVIIPPFIGAVEVVSKYGL